MTKINLAPQAHHVEQRASVQGWTNGRGTTRRGRVVHAAHGWGRTWCGRALGRAIPLGGSGLPLCVECGRRAAVRAAWRAFERERARRQLVLPGLAAGRVGPRPAPAASTSTRGAS